MPFRDRTGPLGKGPMSGRGAGLCAGLVAPGKMNPGPDRGMGRGGRGGRGRAWRNQGETTGLRGWQGATAKPGAAASTPLTTVAPEQEIASLKGQVESLQVTLEQMRKRIEEIGSKPAQK
jgi:hypothetical protein